MRNLIGKNFKRFIIFLFLLTILPSSLYLVEQRQIIQKRASGSTVDTTLVIDTTSNIGIIKPIWNSTASWKSWMWYNTVMTRNRTSSDQNWFVNFFPFFNSVRLQAPLGGNYDNPCDCITDSCVVNTHIPEILKPDGTYDFTHIDQVIRNLKLAGLYPMVDLAQTPKELADQNIICEGFGFYSSTVSDRNRYQSFIANVLNHFIALYGDEVSTKWNFGSFNEPDSGEPFPIGGRACSIGGVCTTPMPTPVECDSRCSFGGTESQMVNDIYLPTIRALKDKNLMVPNNSRFSLGSMMFVDSPAISGSTPTNSNFNVGSDAWMTYFVNTLTANGYRNTDFKSFGINIYGLYPNNHSMFWIKNSLNKIQNMLRDRNFVMPIRNDELGIFHNDNPNTPIHKTSFAASWHAAVIKLFLDLGSNNVDQISPWWYLLLREGNGGTNVSAWKRSLAYYTYLSYFQLTNNQRLSVLGGVFNESSKQIIDAVGAKDAGGIIKALIYNHNDDLSSASTATDPNAPIVDRSTKNINLTFNHLTAGDYAFVVYGANDSNISTNPASLPIIYSQKVTVDSSGTYTYLLVVPHHSVFLVTMQKSFDTTITTDPRTNEVYISWQTTIPTTSYVSYSDISTGFDPYEPISWGKWSFVTDNATPGNMKTTHNIRIGGLIPGKTYFFRVAGKDIIGNGIFHMQVDTKSFTTSAIPTPSPTMTVTPTPVDLINLSFTARLGGVTTAGVAKIFDITFHSTSDQIFTAAATSGIGGVFSFSSLPLTGLSPGTYTVYIKDKTQGDSSSNHLRKLMGSVTLLNGANSVPLSWSTDSNYFLKPGDVNGDNKVTIVDISLMLSIYTNTSIPAVSSNRQDDINGDNVITITDISLALGTYTDLTIVGD